VAIFFKTGKRRIEVANLKVNDLKIKGNYLSITFIVVKKRKKDLMSRKREKQLPLDDEFTNYIIEYWRHMQNHHSNCTFLFPSRRSVFGKYSYVYPHSHLSGRQILRVIKTLSPDGWCHLFRETVGAKIVRADPTIMAPFKVKRRLDLEQVSTAFRYMERYAADVIEKEEQEDRQE